MESLTLPTRNQKVQLHTSESSDFLWRTQSPYVCLDPHFTIPLDDEASAALNTLARTVDENMQEVVLQPGDCCFIDNYRIVHGRKAFKARYETARIAGSSDSTSPATCENYSPRAPAPKCE